MRGCGKLGVQANKAKLHQLRGTGKSEYLVALRELVHYVVALLHLPAAVLGGAFVELHLHNTSSEEHTEATGYKDCPQQVCRQEDSSLQRGPGQVMT